MANSSETHFLSRCDEDACGEGLSCLCGVCSVACAEAGGDACGELAAGGECASLQDESCGVPSICDLSCAGDADCQALSGRHVCEAGRCRAPAPLAQPERQPPDGDCSFLGASRASGTSFGVPERCAVCFCDRGLISCVSNLDPPCNPTVTCEPTTPPAQRAFECELGGVCFPEGTRIRERGGCGVCTCEGGQIDCAESACLGSSSDTPPCATGSCQSEGVCYPSGVVLDNGDCLCADGMTTCNPIARTPPTPEMMVGGRCPGDGGCDVGLRCRSDLAGERALCTRGCNFGCPEGTECVSELPGFDGATIENLCLRPCATQADCDAYGSECDMPAGFDARYCF